MPECRGGVMDGTGFEPTSVGGVQIGVLETEETRERAGIGERFPKNLALGHDQAVGKCRTLAGWMSGRKTDDRCRPGLQRVGERRAAAVDALEIRVAAH